MHFSGKIPFHVAARLTPRSWVQHLLQFATNSPLFAIVRHYSHYSRLFALYYAYYSLFGTIRCSLFATIKLFAIRAFQAPGMKVGEVFSLLMELLDERVTQASHAGKRGDKDVFKTNLFNLVVKIEGKNTLKVTFHYV